MNEATVRNMVLVVDDSEDVLALMAVALRSRGFAVTTARGVREALAYLRTNAAPSLVLLDMRMPDMDGFDFLEARQASEALAAVPVLIYSAEEETAREAQARSGVPYMAKTAPISQVLTKIQAMASGSA